MTYNILRGKDGYGCVITRNGKLAWTHFKVGDTIKHRLKSDNSVIELRITELNGSFMRAGSYVVPYERAFEENLYGVSDDDTLEILARLMIEDAENGIAL